MEAQIKNSTNVIDARPIFARVQRIQKQPFLDYQNHLLAEYDVYDLDRSNYDLFDDQADPEYKELNFNE